MSEKRKADEPGFQWVERVMRSRIASGTYPVGKPLPSTQELANEFDVGVFVINRAMRRMYDLLENGRRAGRIVVHTGTGEVRRPESAADIDPPSAAAVPIVAPAPSVNGEAADDDVANPDMDAEIARHEAACVPEKFRVIGVRKTTRDPRVLLEMWTLLSDSAVRYEGDVLAHGPFDLDPNLARRLGNHLIEMADHAQEKL